MTPGRLAAIHAAETAMSELGWTQAQLADEARLNVRVINSFMNGRNWPQARTRAQIETALKWPVGTLAKIAMGEEPPRSPKSRSADQLRRLITEAQEELTWLNPRYESTRRLISARLEREIEDLKRELRALGEDASPSVSESLPDEP
jgi:transcriptional regulator with XRE-family HTH domain